MKKRKECWIMHSLVGAFGSLLLKTETCGRLTTEQKDELAATADKDRVTKI